WEACSHRRPVAHLLAGGGADPGDLLELVDALEAPVLLAVVHDALRDRGADAGQLVELGDARGVQGAHSAVRSPASRRPVTGTGRVARGRSFLGGRRGGDARRLLPRDGHVDLLAVDDGAGEVHGGELRLTGRAAGG